MNINDYTYHLCDRFILLFVAFVGLVGTSYILVNANYNGNAGQIKSYSLGIQQTSSKKIIDNYTVTLSAAASSVVISQPKPEDQEINLSKSKIDLQSLEYKEVASNPN